MLSRSVTMSPSKSGLATAVSPQLTTSSAIASATPTSVKSNRWLRCRPTPNASSKSSSMPVASTTSSGAMKASWEVSNVIRHPAAGALPLRAIA